MKQAALTAAAIASSSRKIQAVGLTEKDPPQQVYDLNRPLHNLKLDSKIDLVKEAYSSAQDYDSRVAKVQAYLTDEILYLTIANSEGILIADVRPQVRLITIATAEEKENRNTGFYSGGGRIGMGYFQTERTPKEIGRKAAEEAVMLLSAVDPAAGEQPVVLSSDQSGVMIHEAVGHPLEADSNRKKTSIMWDKMGKMVANPIVTITDDPTIPHYRGSLNIDDEGTATKNTVLIEKGKLLTLTTDEAMKHKVADFRAQTIKSVLDQLDLAGAQVRRASPNWAEGLVRFLTNPIISSLLMTIGMLGIILESIGQ